MRPLPDPDRFNLFMRGSYVLARVLARVLLRLTVSGLEDLPTSGPLIVAGNHTTYVDAPLLTAYVAPAMGRPVHWMAKQEAFVNPVLGPIIRAYGGFGVRRGAADTDAYRAARAVLDAGGVLGVFPEGTRSRSGALLEAKAGVALLAMRSGAPILPVGIGGIDRFMPDRSWVPHPGKEATLHVGRPFTLAPLTGVADRHAALAAATTELMVRIGRLIPERQWGSYADPIRASLAAEPAEAEQPADPH